MTQFNTVTLSDYAGANVEFTPGNINYQNGVATWLSAGASFDASKVLSHSIKIPDAKSTRTRTRSRITIPIMDPVVTTKKVDELIVDVSFSIPKTSTLDQRRDLRSLMAAFFTTFPFTASIDSNQGVY